MDNERSAVINIGGKDYELILTTRATKAIAGRYGGLENLVESEEETPKNVEVGYRTLKSLPGFFIMEQFRWVWMRRNSGSCPSDCSLIYGPATSNGTELKSRRKPGQLMTLSRRVYRRR